MFMNSSWFAGLERADPSFLLLTTLAGIIVSAGVLYQVGLVGWVLRGVGLAVRGCIWTGFRSWERLLAWASWPLFLAIVFRLSDGGRAGSVDRGRASRSFAAWHPCSWG